MRIAIDLDGRTVSTWAGKPVKVLAVKRRDRILVEVKFLRAGVAQDFAEGTTGILGIKLGYGGDYLAASMAWTAADGSVYTFDLNLNTVEIATAFASDPECVPAWLEIQWEASGARCSSDAVPVRIGNDIIRGDEQTPTPATALTPVVQFVADVPSAKDDFFMFEGGLAPAEGMYAASDAHYNYTFKGGWTAWRRAAIALWCLAAACWLSGAQYDMTYIQRDGAGDNQERVLTLTPGTFLRVGENGTLLADAQADFRSALGIGSLAGNNTWSGANSFTGSVDFTLATDFIFPRVNIGTADFGWRYNPAGGGQVEFVFPGGTAAFYQTGTPPHPYMYFAGTIQADYLIGSISGITINASGLAGTIPFDVISTSLSSMGSWLPTESNAGTVGISYAADPDSLGNEPTAGDYYPIMRTVVVVSGTNYLNAIYRSATQLRGDLFPSASAALDFPSIAAGASSSLTITVAGIVTTSTPTVSLGWSAALPAGIVVSHAWVSASNTVTVTVTNISGAAVDPASVTCRAAVTQY